MTREELHQRIDAHLDSLGYKAKVNPHYGSITIQINFENDREVISIRERETIKAIKA